MLSAAMQIVELALTFLQVILYLNFIFLGIRRPEPETDDILSSYAAVIPTDFVQEMFIC
jgi:hypothetical protein